VGLLLEFLEKVLCNDSTTSGIFWTLEPIIPDLLSSLLNYRLNGLPVLLLESDLREILIFILDCPLFFDVSGFDELFKEYRL